MNAAWQRMAWRTSAGVCVLLCWLAGSRAAAAEDQPTGTSPAAAATTVSLEFRDVPYALYHWSLPVDERPAPFEKEPQIGSGKVFRGTLQFGKDKTNGLAFVCDVEGGKLHVDLNRNLDLTDDPAGSFTSAYGRGSTYQMFTNVHLPVATLAGVRSTAMDLNLYGFENRFFVGASLRSLWLGQATLDGREWQVGVFDDPLAQGTGGTLRHLLVRPWAEREQPFRIGDGATPVVGLPTQVFLNGRAYGLVASDAGAGDPSRLKLAFTEQHPGLGELRLPGQFIHRLALESGSCLVILEQPGAVVKVPVERYTAASVRLRQGEVEAVRSPRPAAGGVAVAETGSAALVVGGPLTNSVNVNRRGRALVFNYQLLGAGGETYQVVRQGARKAPEFAVFQGDTKITSGKFEFG